MHRTNRILSFLLALALALCLTILPSGALAASSGWVNAQDGRWQYYVDGEAVTSGWKKIRSAWYYFEDGYILQDTEREIDGATYSFTAGGAMRTGWQQDDDGWRYFRSGGAQITDGWAKIGGKWYYFQDGYILQDTEQEIDGRTYRFLANGALFYGWRQVDGQWQLFGTGGALVENGWDRYGGKWYYFIDRAMQTGWVTVDDSTYYLQSSGAMLTGWQKFDGRWYYFGTDGVMTTGWRKIDNDWYYFYPEADSGAKGAMAVSTTTPDGYTIKSDGTAVVAAEINMKKYAQSYSSATSYLIMVNVDACKTGVFRGSYGNWELIKYWNCTPGASSTPTVTGVFTVGSKGYYFDSYGARCYYYTQFYGSYLFHSVLYYPGGGLMDGRVGMKLSHGCVRLAYDNAYWIYSNVPKGSKVVVY